MAIHEKKDLQESPEGLEPRVYEVGYTLIPDIREEDLEKEREALLAHITKVGGEVIAEGNPELIRLGYKISKVVNNKRQHYGQAYFGWVKFRALPEKLEKLESLVEKQDDILRYLIIKTVEENTLYSENPLESLIIKPEIAQAVNIEYPDNGAYDIDPEEVEGEEAGEISEGEEKGTEKEEEKEEA